MLNRIQVMPVSCQQVNLFDTTSKTCNNLSMTLGERIKIAREAAGFNTQAQLAVALGVKQQSVQWWEAGKSKPKDMNKLSSILGVSVDWLLNGTEDILDLPYSLATRCPLLPWDDAKEWPNNKKHLQDSKKLSYPANQIILKGDCFMLQIEDESMLMRTIGEGFHKNRYILIDPQKKYESGNYVVATMPDMPKLLFRQYIKVGKQEYLNPLNISNYNRVDLTPEIKICGVVITYLDFLI